MIDIEQLNNFRKLLVAQVGLKHKLVKEYTLIHKDVLKMAKEYVDIKYSLQLEKNGNKK